MIVGATGALGSAVALGLADLGARLTLTGANRERLNDVAAEVTRRGAETETVHGRPTGAHEADAMIATAITRFGGADGLVVASGTNQVAKITDMDPAQFDEVMNANVRSTWLICRAFGAQALQAGTTGSVVLVSSTRGLLGHPAGYTAYCTSKGAVNLLTRTLAAEWGSAGIRVNAIAPTVFRSDLTAWMYGDEARGVATREGMLARIPLGRLAEPADMVGPVTFFLGAASAFCTGQILYIDGGYTAC